MNPISLSHRKIQPLASRPAVILGFRLRFFSPMGFAEAVRDAGSQFHGVVHDLTEDQMVLLDEVEGHLYHREMAKAQFYDTDETFDVTVYCLRSSLERTEAIPQERYLEIMTEGAKHFGVNQLYVKWLQNLPREPRPSPADFLSFGPCPNVAMTREEVSKFDGTNGCPMYVTMNGKVIELLDQSSRVGLVVKMRRKGILAVEEWAPRMVYDPKYGVPGSIEAMDPEHSAYLEHMMVQRVGGSQACRVVARAVS